MKEPMTKSEFKAAMDVLISIENKILKRGRQFGAEDRYQKIPAGIAAFDNCLQIVRDEMKALYAEVGPAATQIYFDERYQKVLLNKSV